MKVTRNITPFAQYYSKRKLEITQARDEINFILNNKELFKDLIPGKIYIAFENEKPILLKDIGDPIYRFIKINGKGRSRRVSKNGNLLLYRIGICPLCGIYKAGKLYTNIYCLDCQIKGNTLVKKTNYNQSYFPVESKNIIKKKEEPVDMEKLIKHCLYCKFLKTYCKDVINCIKNGHKNFKLK